MINSQMQSLIIASSLLLSFGCYPSSSKTFVVPRNESAPEYEVTLPDGWRPRLSESEGTNVAPYGNFVRGSGEVTFNLMLFSPSPDKWPSMRPDFEGTLETLRTSRDFVSVSAGQYKGGYLRRKPKHGGPFEMIDAVFIGEGSGIFIKIESKSEPLPVGEEDSIVPIVESIKLKGIAASTSESHPLDQKGN